MGLLLTSSIPGGIANMVSMRPMSQCGGARGRQFSNSDKVFSGTFFCQDKFYHARHEQRSGSSKIACKSCMTKTLRVMAMSEEACPPLTQTASPENTKVGFLGLGIMGVPMVRNLKKAGFQVTVWNRTFNESCRDLQEEGVKVAENPREVVEMSDITLAMLADPIACRAVVEGDNSVIDGMRPGKAYIDCSTVDSETSKYVNDRIHSSGGRFLEAPVSGSKGPAEQGQLIFLCAGDKDVFDNCQTILEPLGKKSFFLGETGQGAKMKLVVNMVMGVMMTGLAEGLTFGEAVGLSKSDIVEVLCQGAMACPMFALKGPAMAEDPPRYPTAFPLKHQNKDLRLAMALADEISISDALRLSDEALKYYAAGEEMGLGDQDFSAIQEAVTAAVKK